MHTLVILLGLSVLLPAPFTSTTETIPPHEFHLSKCLIEYNAKEAAIQISLHLFIDDMEEALRRMGADKLFICTDKEAEETERHLTRYLLQHFRLEIDGKLLVPGFLGKEPTEDLSGMWCYLEVTGVPAIEQLTITNEILMDVFDDQKNLVNVIGPSNQKGMFLFQKGESKDSVAFNF